ncbi:hypothetical protein [Microbulbifer hydrolyticus]|uniref:Uncharacterized protein n=1 Tax=Microbulbifer hydrolyticus TaxID=48074 RepID=A0A6P1TBC3_9GAMM|nr:hypothetical protein [Microbulbifer hydrolyticus]MBB5210168.1 hypothetical protein [Microbulbifer hydrolyticus]QHQ39317.1 hypothetical protein GTQ55_10185 [Microbulbifer hydrolyticus]
MGDCAAVQPIAQGDYTYLCDGVPVPVFERWSLFQVGELFALHSTREIPALSAVISARALIGEGRIKQCVLRWHDVDRQKTIAASSYRAEESAPASGRYLYRATGMSTRRVAVGRALYFPLLRIFAGQLLGALAVQENAEAQVLVPWIHDPSQPRKLFVPEFSQRRVRFLEAVCARKGGEILDCYEYVGGQYDRGAIYGMANGLLREYRWQQGRSEWVVQLENLQGCWPGEALWPHPMVPATDAISAET